MCDLLWIEGREDEITTQGELAEFLGGPDALRIQNVEYDPPCCLCPVDLEATMKAAGYTIRRDRWLDYRARKRRPRAP